MNQNHVGMRICLLLTMCVCIGQFLAPTQAHAQQSPLEKLLRRLDTGRDGDLDPNEMLGNTRQWVENLGFDSSTYHRIDVLMEAYRQRGNAIGGASGPFMRKVPTFGNGSDGDMIDTPGFGANSNFVEMNADELTEEYGEEVMEKVYRILSNADSDENGSLNTQEIQNATWGKPMPYESDINNDGTLTLTEIAKRVYGLEKATRGGRRAARNRGNEEGDEEGENENGNQRLRRGGSVPSQNGGGRATPVNAARNNRAIDPGEQARNYANEILAKYDTNQDTIIDPQEQEKMRNKPEADRDGDGSFSSEELVNFYSGNRNGQSAEERRQARGDRPSGNRRSGRRSGSRRSGFDDYDQNQDGQIQMVEFPPESGWDGDIYADWQSKDLNRDGVITQVEWNGG